MSVWDERAQTEGMNGQDLNIMMSLTKGPKVDTIAHAQGPFGYSETNPIPVDDQLGQMEYLACLRCQCNVPFDFHRVGNVGIGPDGHMVDKYELACKKNKHSHVLYLDMYHKGQSSLIPEGMGWGEPKGEGIPFYVSNFPNGLADAFEKEMKMSEMPGAVGMMTRPFPQPVTCMHCEHEQDFLLYSMVNAEQSPELREKILNYELTLLTCDQCGEETDIGYTFFYHDPKTHILFYFSPGEGVLDPSLVDKMFAMLGQEESKSYLDYHCRIVKDRFELADKIRIFEEGLDDRIIEIFKLYVLTARDELAGENERFLYYEGASTKGLKFLSIGHNDAGVATLGRKEYDELCQNFIDQLPEIKSMRGKYLHVDRNYAVDCLEEITGEKEKKSSGGIFSRVTSWFRGS